MLETLDHTIRIGSTPTFLYFDLYLHSACLRSTLRLTLSATASFEWRPPISSKHARITPGSRLFCRVMRQYAWREFAFAYSKGTVIK